MIRDCVLIDTLSCKYSTKASPRVAATPTPDILLHEGSESSSKTLAPIHAVARSQSLLYMRSYLSALLYLLTHTQCPLDLDIEGYAP